MRFATPLTSHSCMILLLLIMHILSQVDAFLRYWMIGALLFAAANAYAQEVVTFGTCRYLFNLPLPTEVDLSPTFCPPRGQCLHLFFLPLPPPSPE